MDEASYESERTEDAKAFADFMLRPTTLPADLVITLSHFADEADAYRCGDVMRGYLDVFGRLMDLSRLERVLRSEGRGATLAVRNPLAI